MSTLRQCVRWFVNVEETFENPHWWETVRLQHLPEEFHAIGQFETSLSRAWKIRRTSWTKMQRIDRRQIRACGRSITVQSIRKQCTTVRLFKLLLSKLPCDQSTLFVQPATIVIQFQQKLGLIFIFLYFLYFYYRLFVFNFINFFYY